MFNQYILQPRALHYGQWKTYDAKHSTTHLNQSDRFYNINTYAVSSKVRTTSKALTNKIIQLEDLTNQIA